PWPRPRFRPTMRWSSPFRPPISRRAWPISWRSGPHGSRAARFSQFRAPGCGRRYRRSRVLLKWLLPSLLERPLLPPWEIGGHSVADLHGEFRSAFLEEGSHALPHVSRLAARIDALGIDLVRLHRMVGAQHLPEHLAIERDRHRRGVIGDFA